MEFFPRGRACAASTAGNHWYRVMLGNLSCQLLAKGEVRDLGFHFALRSITNAGFLAVLGRLQENLEVKMTSLIKPLLSLLLIIALSSAMADSLVLIIALSSAMAEDVSIEVYKSPYCGCCENWVAHLKQNGFAVISHDQENMREIKSEFNIPAELQSCHTAVINGYFIEGHVPARDIKKLLTEHPDIRGLSVPGMPAGTNVPGMETRPAKASFDVFSVGEDGTQIYSHYE